MVLVGAYVSMMPGGDAILLAAKMAAGQLVTTEDLVYAALSIGGGAAILKIVGKFWKTRRIVKARDSGRTISLPVLQQLCFARGTRVWMSDGSTKPIESIKSGDLVMCDSDPELANGAEECVVERTYERVAPSILIIEVSYGDGAFEIASTPEHPFFLQERRVYIAAGKLRVGQEFHSAGQVACTVRKKSEVVDPIVVYNFEVSHAHNYYIGDDTESIQLLVHNTCPFEEVFSEVGDAIGIDAI